MSTKLFLCILWFAHHAIGIDVSHLDRHRKFQSVSVSSGHTVTRLLFLSCAGSKNCVDKTKSSAGRDFARHITWLNMGDLYWIVFLGQYTTLIAFDALLLALLLGIPWWAMDTN